jgi:hypothetical protein
VFAAGSPDALSRTVDVGALSSWLAVRAIDRETRRLDSIDRGEVPPAALPTSIPPPALTLPPAKPKMSGPRLPSPPQSSNAPVVSQQVAPLPPAIDIRPAPGARPPKPRPPLALTPPAAN